MLRKLSLQVRRVIGNKTNLNVKDKVASEEIVAQMCRHKWILKRMLELEKPALEL